MHLRFLSDSTKFWVSVQVEFAVSQRSKLFVYGVNANCPREVLANEFGRFGEVTDVYNTGRGFAFVTMTDENAAQDAIK